MACFSAQPGTARALWLTALVVSLTTACVVVHDERPDRTAGDASGVTSDASLSDAARPALHHGDSATSADARSDGGPSAAQPTTIVLENVGAQPVVIGTECGGAWLRIEHAGRAIAIDRACRCSCREMESAPGCGSCPAVCTSTAKQLAPAGKESYLWDGVELDHTNGKGCYVESTFAVGTELTATACWNLDPQTGQGTCTSQKFLYGVDRNVVVRAQPAAAAPLPVKFTLENRTGATISLTERCGGVSTWFDIETPGLTTSRAAFCPCSCNAQYEREGCAVCGGCVEDVVYQVAPGATFTSTWNGLLLYSYPSGCAEPFAVPIRSPLRVVFCWSTPGADAGAETCASRDIVHGADAITLVAQ